jgi:hypothetical protein
MSAKCHVVVTPRIGDLLDVVEIVQAKHSVECDPLTAVMPVEHGRNALKDYTCLRNSGHSDS